MLKIMFTLIAALSLGGLVTAYSVKKTGNELPVADPEYCNVAVSAAKTPDNEPKKEKRKKTVLVELFTSEGCSSCPPADRNLIYLNDKQPFSDAEVITLSMHVDYWNRLGWTDRFSSAQFSERQRFYSDALETDGAYTPQMVVDGKTEFVGGNLNSAREAITEALDAEKGDVQLTAADNKLQVKIENLTEHSAANVFLAIAEDNLSTAVGSGENGGRTLNHSSVVRELKSIGRVGSGDKSFSIETAFSLKSQWKKQNLKLVVFVQETGKTSQIIGVGQIKL